MVSAAEALAVVVPAEVGRKFTTTKYNFNIVETIKQCSGLKKSFSEGNGFFRYFTYACQKI